MQKFSLNQLRKLYLDFFESKNHLRLKSASLIPNNDNSLLIINSGMAQFKPYFKGQEIPPSKRITTCQKCVRTNDIENVGKTSRHATFFEMLGNFSFGDYFKEEAISWAWEFVTEVLKLPYERLSVTIFQDDDQAFDIWHNKIGLAENKIFRMGKEDNFWEIGTGPCGPCSEIYFDRGEKYGCGKENCQPGCDCDRFIEIWNLVFTQFNHNNDGSYSKLSQCNIDTGMGLERIAAVMQDVDSIFDIDTSRLVIDEISKISGTNYGTDKRKDVSIRIIADHIKAVTFMLGDDIFPSNEGRGYVLRRLIRRAICCGKNIGLSKEFLCQLSGVIIKNFSDAYPNLLAKQKQILENISHEEKKFSETLETGLNLLNKIIVEVKAENKNIISGKIAFKLYDTFGFPLDITKEIADENNLQVDEKEFALELDKQKERARNCQQNENKNCLSIEAQDTLKNFDDTNFVGYECEEVCDAKILALIDNNKFANTINNNKTFLALFDKTPFFAESAGQVSDAGTIETESGRADVIDCQKILCRKYIHKCVLKEGCLMVGQTAKLKIDQEKRLNIARNHTSTHLLHKALQNIIDKSVKQMGSYVDDKRLRFDFLCQNPIDKRTLNLIEDEVNRKILSGLDVKISMKNVDEAIAEGATALFGEKYGNVVRVVDISDYSVELCSGLHLKNTSQAGLFKIVSEGSISSGVRRIEAVTGKVALESIRAVQEIINSACSILKTDKNDLLDKLQSYVKLSEETSKKLDSANKTIAKNLAEKILLSAEKIGDIDLVVSLQENADMKFLQLVSDEIKSINSRCAIFLFNRQGRIVNLTASATNNVDLHVGNIVKEITGKFGGKGGGKKNYAQAGNIPSDKIDSLINELKSYLL